MQETTPSPPFGSRIEDLDWIDGFARSIAPYVRVRPEDGALIKMPLETWQLNPTGARLLAEALRGVPARHIATDAGADAAPERIRQIHTFFCDVRDLLSGEMGDARRRLATDVDTFREGFTRFPVLSELALTYRCNLSCRFCYAACGEDAEANRYAGRRGEMTRREILRVIDVIALEAKAPSISFTGGEPTLHPDLPRFVRHAVRRGLRVNLITNAVACATGRLARRLARAGLASAQISIEGPTAREHDALTGRKGSFDASLAGLDCLRRAGLSVHTNTTICRANLPALTGIVDLAVSLRLPRVSMNMMIPTGASLRPNEENLAIRYGEIGDAVRGARQRARELGIEFHWYSPTPYCLFNPVAEGLGNKGCAACDGLLHVAPNGDVLPCSSFGLEDAVGNLLDDGFEAVWFGERARYYKKKRMAPDTCDECENLAVCQGACVLYWRRFGVEELKAPRPTCCASPAVIA